MQLVECGEAARPKRGPKGRAGLAPARRFRRRAESSKKNKIFFLKKIKNETSAPYLRSSSEPQKICKFRPGAGAPPIITEPQKKIVSSGQVNTCRNHRPETLASANWPGLPKKLNFNFFKKKIKILNFLRPLAKREVSISQRSRKSTISLKIADFSAILRSKIAYRSLTLNSSLRELFFPHLASRDARPVWFFCRLQKTAVFCRKDLSNWP